MAAKKITMTFQPVILREMDRQRGIATRSAYLASLVRKEMRNNA